MWLRSIPSLWCLYVAWSLVWGDVTALSLRPLTSSTTFYGNPLLLTTNNDGRHNDINARAQLYMRKQKASDKRTRRRQRGLVEESPVVTAASLTTSPMQQQGTAWTKKTTTTSMLPRPATGGRGRSRKRSMLYTSLSFYHNKFMRLLQEEFKAEVRINVASVDSGTLYRFLCLVHTYYHCIAQEDEVLGRIKASLDDPISLEVAGYALYDVEASRRGNLFADEVYRLAKASDATTVYQADDSSNAVTDTRKQQSQQTFLLPRNHKFRPNDVILLTLQPNGSGDFFDPTTTSPLSEQATQLEARVLNVGPSYVDIAVQAGKFAATLGPTFNEPGGSRQTSQRLRVDRFFSNIPYQRMVDALKQLSQIPDRQQQQQQLGLNNDEQEENSNSLARIRMDTILSQAIVSTHAFADAESPLLRDPSICDLEELAKHIARPPMPTSGKLAHQAIRYMMAHPQTFRPLNDPQLAAVEAALTRRLTLIQGPPGTGKTVTAASIGFGMVHQCRSISADSAKVLACAFSNVGADNLAQALQNVGLKVVRIGKPSAVTQSLWNNTLDAAIDRDLDARKALEVAAKAAARLSKVGQMDKTEERLVRQSATNAVKASQKACLVAATKAMRAADVIVSTSTGAADPRLLAACGIVTGQQEEEETRQSFRPEGRKTTSADDRTLAPDGLPPLSLPFVIVDEACQSVEPATLVPLVSSDTCRSLVLLGDPCQLPPTVRSSDDSTSPLSVSLMERLASILPAPHARSASDTTPKDTSFLAALPMKQCRSLLHALEKNEGDHHRSVSYRKRYAGSLLLSIQYRMHPSIAAFPSAIFYDGLLATPEFMRGTRHLPQSLQDLFPCPSGDENAVSFRWINVGGKNNERRGSLSGLASTSFGSSPESVEEQTSYLNEPEAAQAMDILENIISLKDPAVKTIGIISPYAAQVQLIQSLLRDNPALQNKLEAANVELEVNSVDGYQVSNDERVTRLQCR